MSKEVIEKVTTINKNEIIWEIQQETDQSIWKQWQPNQVILDDIRKNPSDENEGSPNNLADLLNHDESKEHTISLKTQTERNQLSNAQWKEKSSNMIHQKLDDALLSDEYILSLLKRGLEEAVIQGPKGDILEDRRTKKDLIKEVLKLRWYYKDNNQIVIINQFQNNNKLY